MSVNSKMTAIADEIRGLLGLNGTMGLDAMAANLVSERSNVSDALGAIAGKGVAVPDGSTSGDLAALIELIGSDGGAYVWEKYSLIEAKYSVQEMGETDATTTTDAQAPWYDSYSLDEKTGVFTLIGESENQMTAQTYCASKSSNKRIYKRRLDSANQKTWVKKIESVYNAAERGDTRYGVVTSDDEAAYPNDGEQDGYWYVFVGENNSGGGSGGIDTSDATATAEDMREGTTAYVNGEKITGSIPLWTSISWNTPTASWDSENSRLKLLGSTGARRFLESSSRATMYCSGDKLGDATAEDVTEGKTFTSAAGMKVTGTAKASAPTLQEKTITPSVSEQIVNPDVGYDGLSQVTVEAMPTAELSAPAISVDTAGKITATVEQAAAGYVASGSKSTTKQMTTKGAATITPGTSDQTIASGTYLTGAQTVKGDANLVAGNIKSGVSIFGVAGSFAGSGGSGGSGGNNCEAYHITSISDTISFKGTGTVKVWGYGKSGSGYSETKYAFVGDGYYSGTYSSFTKTSKTFSIASDGTLSGLPSGLTAVDLLVEIGV